MSNIQVNLGDILPETKQGILGYGCGFPPKMAALVQSSCKLGRRNQFSSPYAQRGISWLSHILTWIFFDRIIIVRLVPDFDDLHIVAIAIIR